MAETPEELEAAFLEAERLRTDPAFSAAVLAVRKDAVTALISTPADNMQENLRLRAEINAINGLCQKIADAITRRPRVTKPVA